MRILKAPLLSLLLAACAGPLLPFTTDGPPVVLTTLDKAGIADDRGRFREILCAVQRDHGAAWPDDRPCARILWTVGEEPPATGRPVALGPPGMRFRVVAVTGFGADCFAPYVRMLEDAEPLLRTLGHRLEQVPVTAFGSVAQNARILRDFLRRLETEPDERIVLLGYSKGVPDSLEALRLYPEVRRKVAAFVSLAGAVNGSPLAEAVPGWIDDLVALLPGTACHMGDEGGLADLRPRVRLEAVAAAPVVPPVPSFSLVAFAPETEISTLLRPFWARLAGADPRNDGQVLWYDQLVPGSTLLGYLRGDHLAVGVPVARKMPLLAAGRIDRNAFPRAILLEAVLRYLEERLAAPVNPPPAAAAPPRRSSPAAGSRRS